MVDKPRELDTVGLMAQDVQVATSVIQVLLMTDAQDMTTNHCSSSSLQLLYPVDFFRASREYADFVEPVVQKLETFLGVRRTDNIDIRAQLIEGVSDGRGSLEEFLKNVGGSLPPPLFPP